MIDRFGGVCEQLCEVDVVAIIDWIVGIDFQEWPQQHRLADGIIRPAMVCDPAWHRFKDMTEAVVQSILTHFHDCIADTRMLSVVMPTHEIPPHVDHQSADWRCRVHIPLTSNTESKFVVGGAAHQLKPGRAYKVNTEAIHSVTNHGPTPRIHFMFDTRLRSN